MEFPGKIISLIQCTYQDMSCRIAHAGPVVRKLRGEDRSPPGMPVVPVPLPPGHRLDHEDHYSRQENGIQWTLWTQLDDLDFADDLALLSHSHSQMQDKTTRLEATSAGTGLKINMKKTELMKINTTANTPVTVGGEPIREVESFVYLGSVVDGQGGTDRDVTARIGKARAAMVMLKNVWASKVVSIRTKLRIFKLQREVEKIRNEELWERAGQEPVAKQILRRKVGLDWTHPQEASIQHHTPSPDMEPTGEKEERPASQQLEAGH
nr:hypothetical protein BaRGS_029448 [Batillaria attramentaria]